MSSGWAIGISVILAAGILLALDMAADYYRHRWGKYSVRRLNKLAREVRAIERKKDADV